MNLVLSWSTYYGKPNEVLRVVLMSGAVMIVFEPYILFSLSFILSFLATLSLVLFGNTFDFITNRFEGILGIFIKDFFTTINAQILVWPVISMSFGSLSLISPMANALVLWTVPIITILGSLLLLVGLVVKFAASMLSYPIYFIISFFVVILENCSRINVFSYSISYFRFNVDITTSLYYYLGLLVLLIFKSKIKELIEKAVVYLKIKIG
jgi:competence protein ComEC